MWVLYHVDNIMIVEFLKLEQIKSLICSTERNKIYVQRYDVEDGVNHII